MAVDTFICGACDVYFFSLGEFVDHKKACPKEGESVTDNLSQDNLSQEVSHDESSATNTSVCESIEQGNISKPGIELVAVNQRDNGKPLVDYEVVVRPPISQSQGGHTASGRKRGRPRKSDDKMLLKQQSTLSHKPEKPVIPDKGVDGKLHCVRCKLSFTRERTFTAHKCLAKSDYVDVTKKEVVSGSDSGENLDGDDDDTEAVYPKIRKVYKKRKQKIQNFPRDMTFGNSSLASQQGRLAGSLNELPEDRLAGGDGNSLNITGVDQSNIEMNESGDMSAFGTLNTSKSSLFRTDEERFEFEEAINVDLSMVDDMYSTHLIEQNLNENAHVDMPRSNQLTIFSCNTCDKVFKTLSHMRLHCLTHTDLKPFQCPKCEYTSNSKGNMYTHMRKHTGQFFMCPHCNFMTVNKTHLKEHEGTHTSERHECKVCKKDYNTVKSLVNHVRKYHLRTKEGREYLETLQPKTNRMNGLLYLCHVCNRKFKKKVDRDRHLFVHNIRDGPNVATCELCDYVASRRVYLMAHYKKHRVVYRCTICKEKFLSTIRLQNHVIEEHEAEYNLTTWDELFGQCLNISFYLPELSPNGEEHSNIPIELTAAGKGEDTMSPQMPDDKAAEEEESKDCENNFEQEDIYKKLGFRPLSLKVLETLRDTFGNMECEFCGRLFGSKMDFEPHLRTHTGEKPFPCELCSYRGNTKDNLKRHVEKEHDDRTYPCQECNFVAKNRTQLWSHTQKHCNTQCNSCGLKFGNRRKLRIHLKARHPELTGNDIDKMTGLAKLRIRGKIGKKSFKCPYCERVFLRSASDLQKHIWIHQDVKPFQCEVCSYACRSKNNLKSHMLRHSSHKPFACEFCGKAYKSKTALRWHERSHKEGKMKCDKCPYEATQKSHLKRHMETHDVVKQFVCQHCDYSANTVGYMKIHYTRFHKGVQFSSAQSKLKSTVLDAKVFKCLSCDYLFGNLSDMKRHLKIRHHIQVDDMQALDTLSIDAPATTQFCLPVEHTEQVPTSEIQVVHISEPPGSSSEEIDATAALQALHYSGGEQVAIDEKTASAVNILQQIIDMSQQGVPQSSEGDEGLVAVNPEAIIVHQDGEVVVSSAKVGDMSEQVVIQYIHSDEPVGPHVDVVSQQEIINIATDTSEVE